MTTTQSVPKIATGTGTILTRGTAYRIEDVPALAQLIASDAAIAEHAPHGTEMTFLGWAKKGARPIFRCTCGQGIATAAETNPLRGHDIGCAVQSGVACDCRDAYTG